jgi:putative peptidoglycan lipid II flippase
VAFGLVRVANLGHAGLALATSSVALFSFLVLFWIMKRRLGGVHGRRLRSVIVKVAAGSFLMALAVMASHWAIGLAVSGRSLRHFADLVITIPIGVATVFYSCRWMQVEELEMATRALAGPIARRIPRRA